ncbi:hypothetical protein [Glaciecola sp. 1036]|uniref:hypothetical protein n=1 Tax=Alteromonadaceae TaxID=72275 RepID=UPI003CFF8ABE
MKTLLLTLVLVSGAVFAKPPESTMQLGMVIFPPFTIVDDGGSCQGTLNDLMTNVFKESTYNFHLTCASPKRIYRSITNNSLDLSINVKTTKMLEGLLSYSEIPFSRLTIIQGRNPNAKEKNTVSLLYGFDYNGHAKRLIDSGVAPVHSNSVEVVTNAFLLGRTEYLLAYKRPYEHFKQKLELSDTPPIKDIIIEEVDSIDAFIAVNKGSKEHDKLISLVNSRWVRAAD